MVRNISWIRPAAAAALAVCACVAAAAPKVDFAAILADPGRPDADRARDADRKPAEVIAFAHVGAGDKVAELAPGGGYFTNILSAVVGPKGRIYAIAGHPSPALQALAKARPNVVITPAQPGTIPTPEPLDIVWTTLNYHDFKNQKIGDSDGAAKLNAAAFNALKRGGTYIIVDHEAGRGVGASVTSTLHRIDSDLVRREVEQAGFQLATRSDILRNPADDHSKRVDDPAIRGKTDQFMYRFRKP
jgi:predicted methyltransferase